MLWPLPVDHVDDPECTPAAMRARYTQLLALLANADPAVHDQGLLDRLAGTCQWWGLPSPYDEAGRLWARGQLGVPVPRPRPARKERQPWPRTEPAAPVVEAAGSPGAED